MDAQTVDNVMNDVNDIALSWYSELNPPPPPTPTQVAAQPTVVAIGNPQSPVFSASGPSIGLVALAVALVVVLVLAWRA